MMYLMGVLVGCLLVLGQTLWKIAIGRSGFELSGTYLLSNKVWSFLLSPFLITGMIVYVVATVFYMAMLGKYQYSTVQALVVPLSLIAAFMVARFAFNERVSMINLLGLLVLVVGTILATKR